jgi:hypothetical protein
MTIVRTALLTMLLATGGMVAGCSGDDDSGFEPTGEVTTSDPGTSDSDATVVRVDTGKWSNDVMVPTLVEYLEARQASMRERRIVPDMVETATFQWIQRQRAVIADAQQRDWTVPAAARMRIVGIESGDSDAVVQVCMWGPSVDFVDAETGEPVRAQKRQWYPFDVKMVMAGDRWYVAAAAEGAFGCEVDDG